MLNLGKNVGSQKAIFFGLKYLQKIIKKKWDVQFKKELQNYEKRI